MTFNDLMVMCDRAGQKRLADGLYQYILINFHQKDFAAAAQMMTDLIVNWEPEVVTPESWVISTDFAFAQNFAALMRSRGVLPPPEPVILLTEEDGEGIDIIVGEEEVTTEYVNDR